MTWAIFDAGATYEASMWIMELLVLLLIAYEVGNNIWHERAERKSKIILAERIESVRKAISEGSYLQRTVSGNVIPK